MVNETWLVSRELNVEIHTNFYYALIMPVNDKARIFAISWFSFANCQQIWQQDIRINVVSLAI